MLGGGEGEYGGSAVSFWGVWTCSNCKYGFLKAVGLLAKWVLLLVGLPYLHFPYWGWDGIPALRVLGHEGDCGLLCFPACSADPESVLSLQALEGAK